MFESESLEIPKKRKILYDFIWKMIEIQKAKEVSMAISDQDLVVKELNLLYSKFEDFDNKILNKFQDLAEEKLNVAALKRFLEKMTPLATTIPEEVSLLNSVSIILKEKHQPLESDVQKPGLSQDSNQIITRLQKIGGILSNLEIDLGRISSIQEKQRKEILEENEAKLVELKRISTKFKQLESQQDVNALFNMLQESSRQLRYQPLLYSISQISRSYKDGRISAEKARNLFDLVLYQKFTEALVFNVLLLIEKASPGEIATLVGIETDRVFQALLTLIDDGKIEGRMEDSTYFPIKKEILLQKSISNLKKALTYLIKTSSNEIVSIIDEIIRKIDDIDKILLKIRDLDETPFQTSLQEINEMVSFINLDLGGASSSENIIKSRLDGMIEAIKLGRLYKIIEKEQILIEEEKVPENLVERITDASIITDYKRGLILSTLRTKGALSLPELTNITGLPSNELFIELQDLKNADLITIVGEREGYHLFDIPRILTPDELFVDDFIEKRMNAYDLILNLEEQGKNIERNFHSIKNTLTSLRILVKSFDSLSFDGLEFGNLFAESFLNVISEVQETFSKIKTTVKVGKIEIDFDKLVPIPIPQTEDEFAHLIEPTELMGFGTIECNESLCLTCGKCESVCPEGAAILKQEWNIPLFFKLTDEELKALPENRRMLIQSLRNIAKKTPERPILIPRNAKGYGRATFNPMKCIACKECVDKCPIEAITFEEIWNFPEVLKGILKLT